MTDDTRCFQCGRPLEMELPEDPKDAGWFVCGWCGERAISVEEFQAESEANAEERVKQALGFYQFKRSKE